MEGKEIMIKTDEYFVNHLVVFVVRFHALISKFRIQRSKVLRNIKWREFWVEGLWSWSNRRCSNCIIINISITYCVAFLLNADFKSNACFNITHYPCTVPLDPSSILTNTMTQQWLQIIISKKKNYYQDFVV